MAACDGPNEPKKPSNKTNSICQVCGEDASIINYGALSCLSCRTFFRRNAFPNKEVPVCRFDGACQVTVLTRKVCTACRLAKCLAVGMSPDLIRKEDIAATKRKFGTSRSDGLTVMVRTSQSIFLQHIGIDLIDIFIIQTIPQATTSNLRHRDRHSQLDASNQILISNILHAFDAFSPVAEVRHTIEMLKTSASDIQYDVSHSLRIMSAFYNSLQLFISSTPDFKVLTPTEQCSLLQRNMLGLLCIGGMYLMRESGIFDKPEHEMVLLPLYGAEVLQQAKMICQQINGDPVLFKLMLVALAFSSNCYMLHNRGNIDKDSLLFGTFRLLGSQNVYVELMWKYLIHTYNHNIAVKEISTLVKQLLDTLNFSIDLYENNQIHQAFIDDTIEQTEKFSIINEKAVIPLWGKK